jgi:hypothetical protein
VGGFRAQKASASKLITRLLAALSAGSRRMLRRDICPPSISSTAAASPLHRLKYPQEAVEAC